MTVADLIRRALRAIGVLHHAEEPTAAEAADALATLNDMLHSWVHRGINLEIVAPLVLTDTLPWPDDHAEAMRYNLAVLLAPEFGKQADPVIVGNAERSFDALKTAYLQIGTLAVDEGLSPVFNPNRQPGVYKDFS